MSSIYLIDAPGEGRAPRELDVESHYPDESGAITSAVAGISFTGVNRIDVVKLDDSYPEYVS